MWKVPAGTIPATPGYHAVDMFRALKRGDLKALWIQTTNPWVTLPNRSRFDRTPGDGRFIVVSDIYPTPTTAIADLILPAAAWVEREGMFGNTERRTQHWKKMVDPPGEAREDAWQVMEVAKRMGMGHLFPWPDDNWHEPMFEEYPIVRARAWQGPGELRRAHAHTRHDLAGRERQGNTVSLHRRVRPVREEGHGRTFLQGRGLRRKGGLLDAAVPAAGGSPGPDVSRTGSRRAACSSIGTADR